MQKQQIISVKVKVKLKILRKNLYEDYRLRLNICEDLSVEYL